MRRARLLISALLPLTGGFAPPSLLTPARHACCAPAIALEHRRPLRCRVAAVAIGLPVEEPEASASEAESAAPNPLEKKERRARARARLALRMWGFSSSGEQLGPHIVVGGKVLNWFGALYIFQALVWAVFWSFTMSASRFLSTCSSWDPKRKFFDMTGKLWSYWNMKVGGCAPHVVTGLEHVPGEGTPVVFAANHASWFDIPLIAQCIPSTFKFVASESLQKLPLIGQQLKGGKHVLIDRRSRKSQLRSFKESVDWLHNGVSIMAFPEGTRSRDGKLAKKFKGGVFAMATRTKVPIVPISLVGTFSTFPPEALMPYGPKGRDLAVHFHPPIPTEGRTEAELQDLCRAAIASKLPASSVAS